MNPTDSLPLRDIHLPDPVSWWPPAMGWWFLLLASVLVLWLLYIIIRKLLKPVLKKSAKAELAVVIAAYQQHQNKHLLIQQLSILLRRIGISYLPRNEIAGVSGMQWYEKINQLASNNQFSDDMIQLLSRGPYQQNPQLDEHSINTLIDQTEHWVSALTKEKGSV